MKQETKTRRDGETKWQRVRPRLSLRLCVSSYLRLCLPILLATPLASCTDNRRPSAEQRQDELLRNPFGYKSDDTQDVSGGDIHRLDRNAMKKDLGNVLNP
jgi:hypothetical protein